MGEQTQNVDYSIRRRFAWIVKATRDVRLTQGVLTQVGPAFRTFRISASTIEAVCRCVCGEYRVVVTQRLRTPGHFMRCTCRRNVTPWIVAHRRRERIRKGMLTQIAPAFRTRRYNKSTVEAVFRCECGRHIVCPTKRVVDGDIVSCRCKYKRIEERSLLVSRRSAPVVTATLSQVGHAFRAWRGGTSRTMAVFVCVCGNHTLVDVNRVVSGDIQSCGCRSKLKYHLQRLVADREILEVRSRLGDSVDTAFCENNESGLTALYAAVGSVPAHSMLTMVAPGRGWVPGNLQWVSVARYVQCQQIALMAHTLTQCRLMSRRNALVQRSWQVGSDGQIMAAIVADCGTCPSEYHVLTRLDQSSDWVIGNVAWLAKNDNAAELLLLLRKRIARATRNQKADQRTHRDYARRMIDFRGGKTTIRELAELAGCTYDAMSKRLVKCNFDAEAAVASRRPTDDEVTR
jgi:hypothetical protein